MNTQRAYINGFVKRANEYGYTSEQAITLLKQATVADNTHHTLNINSKPVVQPMAPKPVVKKDPMQPNPLAAYGPKINIPPVDPPEHVPMPNNWLNNQQPPTEHEIQSLADLPLSSMTPKDHWTQGLHDILAKRPATQLRNIYPNRSTEGMRNSTNMQTWQHAMNLEDGLLEARLPGYMDKNYPLGKDVKTDDPRLASMGHVKELAAHFNKYDSSWGDSFRIPIADEPVYESDNIGGLRSTFIKNNRDLTNTRFNGYIAQKARINAQNNPQTTNVNIPTGL